MGEGSLLYALFEWLDTTSAGDWIRQSIWTFPVVQCIHLLGLATLGGSVLLVDMRLLGLGLRGQDAAALMRAALPWQAGAIGVMVVSGTFMAMAEAMRLYYTPSFWVKMIALCAVLLFTFAIRNPLIARGHGRSAVGAVIGLVSIGLWVTVAAAGRWIGFS